MRRPALFCLLVRPTYGQPVSYIYQDTRYRFFSAQTLELVQRADNETKEEELLTTWRMVNTPIVEWSQLMGNFHPPTVETITPSSGHTLLWKRPYQMNFGTPGHLT